MKPLIENLYTNLSRDDRRGLVSALSGSDRTQRYQRYAEIMFLEYFQQNDINLQCIERPADFLHEHGHERCLIEIVTPSPGEHPKLKAYVLPSHDTAKTVPEDEIIWKYWESIDRKAKILSERLETISAFSNAKVVIAVCPILLSDPPWAALGHDRNNYPYVMRAVLPIGGAYLWIEPASGREGLGISRQDYVQSLIGSERPTTLFLDSGGSHISAVVAFGPEDGWFNPWRPIVIHNPNASSPLRLGHFPTPLAEYTIEISPDQFRIRRH